MRWEALQTLQTLQTFTKPLQMGGLTFTVMLM